ncbi:hypothetical protein CY34DRAFT_589255 [Suillus luteus UH-Slu-Lm8-n1]|uniref:Secreted protein n=1 Tax=Suillus luteus UH-Slu-Lm8-n1 TaxID=930992 RepID=A0A0D0BFH2_9AGAM|nr:hypothetical protein CY34DRAFT_589255 [Suillus luteus UH-Slu-Lm8-n1]
MYILLQVAAILDVLAGSNSLEHNAASGSTTFLVTSSPQLEMQRHWARTLEPVKGPDRIRHCWPHCFIGASIGECPTLPICLYPLRRCISYLLWVHHAGNSFSVVVSTMHRNQCFRTSTLLTRRVVEKIRGKSLTYMQRGLSFKPPKYIHQHPFLFRALIYGSACAS